MGGEIIFRCEGNWDGGGREVGHPVGQANKQDNGESVSDLYQIRKCAWVVPRRQGPQPWQLGVHRGLFEVGASVFHEILLRPTLGREPGKFGSDFWFPYQLALWLWANPLLTSFLHL